MTSPRAGKHRHDLGEARLLVEVIDHQRLLRLPRPASGRLRDRQFVSRLDSGGHGALQNVQAHHLARRVIKDKAKELKTHQAMQALGEIVEEAGQAPVGSNRLRHLKQRLALKAEGLGCLATDWPVAHRHRG